MDYTLVMVSKEELINELWLVWFGSDVANMSTVPYDLGDYRTTGLRFSVRSMGHEWKYVETKAMPTF